MRARSSRLLVAGSLVVASLTAVLTTPSPAVAETFVERWCSDTPAPCTVSATRNGIPLTKSDPTYRIIMIGKQDSPAFTYTQFIVEGRTVSDVLSTGDTYSVTLDLGDLRPESTQGYAARPDVDRIDDGDGTYQVRYTGKPVLLTQGCTSTYPVTCDTTASSQSVVFTSDVQQLKVNLEFRGFDSSQSADKVNGIFLEHDSTGAAYLTSEWNNSHYQTDGTTVAQGQARFRIPYSMLTSQFEVPDPSTLVASSLVGTINGKPATFDISQDPEGGGVYVDISGVTFSRKVVRVTRGSITPTRPTLTKATRTNGHRGRLAFKAATPRGAKVRGYQARCISGRTIVRATVGKRAHSVVVTGLAPRRSYTCSVRATSKAGPGRWSRTKRL